MTSNSFISDFNDWCEKLFNKTREISDGGKAYTEMGRSYGDEKSSLTPVEEGKINILQWSYYHQGDSSLDHVLVTVSPSVERNGFTLMISR